MRGRGPLLRGSTLSPTLNEPAVIEVEESGNEVEKGGVGYNLHHFSYSKAVCGGER